MYLEKEYDNMIFLSEYQVNKYLEKSMLIKYIKNRHGTKVKKKCCYTLSKNKLYRI